MKPDVSAWASDCFSFPLNRVDRISLDEPSVPSPSIERAFRAKNRAFAFRLSRNSPELRYILNHNEKEARILLDGSQKSDYVSASSAFCGLSDSIRRTTITVGPASFWFSVSSPGLFRWGLNGLPRRSFDISYLPSALISDPISPADKLLLSPSSLLTGRSRSTRRLCSRYFVLSRNGAYPHCRRGDFAGSSPGTGPFSPFPSLPSSPTSTASLTTRRLRDHPGVPCCFRRCVS